jgi:hypothetical protein
MADPRGDPKELVAFTRAAADRVAEMVRRVEAMYRTLAPDRGKGPTYLPNQLIPARTKSGGITAGSQSSPSTNSVTLLVPSGTGDGLTTGEDVNVLNYSTRAISGAGKLIYLEFFNGKMTVPLGDC